MSKRVPSHERRMEHDHRLVRGNPDAALPSLREDRVQPCWNLSCSCGWRGGRIPTTLGAIKAWRKHEREVADV